MRLFAIGAAILGLAACASTTAREEPLTSWGKPSVTLVEYWTDSAECTLAGAQANVTLEVGNLTAERTAETPALPELNRQTSGNETSAGLTDTLMRQHQNRLQQRRNDAAARQAVIDDCLGARGYRQFRLTADQAAHLATLEHGSTPRRRYLHQLGSDAAVLQAQGL